MEFFDSLINMVAVLTATLTQQTFCKGSLWPDAGSSQVVMRRDTAFELEGIGFDLVTSKEVRDEIVVIGDDLSEIKNNQRFSRISIVEIGDVGDEQMAYYLIKKIEYVKYHCFPDGYMMRSTSRSHKEAVRVSRNAVKSGIDFRKVGSLLIDKYKENPSVKGVKVIFVTDPNANFAAIETVAAKKIEITEALNHVMNSVNFDCNTCNLKTVCDEIEGMRELHFKTSNRLN